MTKTLITAKNFWAFVVIAVPILHLILAFWRLLDGYIPFATHLATNKILLTTVVVSYLFFFPALFFIKLKFQYRSALLIVFFPVCLWVVSVYSFSFTKIKASTKTQEKIFHHIAQKSVDISYVQHFLYACNLNDLNCVSFYIDNNADWDAEFFVDENSNEVYLFEDIGSGVLRYSYARIVKFILQLAALT